MTLRERLALLEKRAADKLAEIKDDTAADAARAIEKDHEAILAEIAEVRAQITAAEAEEAAASRAAPKPAEQPDVAAEVRRAQDAERKRASEIRKLAKEAGEVELGDEHIDEGRSVAEFRSALLEKLMKREAPATDNRSPARVGEEHHEKRAVAMREALMHRADPSHALTDGAREYRGFSLMDMAREALEVRGVKTRGMSREEIARDALAQRSGYGSTSDFPIILGNVVNTTLRAGYEAAGQTFRPLVREATVSDFKAVNRAQLGEGPAFDKVNESGEFKRGTVAEGKESYKIATFGKVIAITRQVIINDDMNAFGRIPQLMGGAAAQLESDLVWAQILGNPTMGDNVALFHANHNNLPTAAAFGVTALGVARAQMAKQTGLDGKTVLNIRPQFLIVPVALETKAEQELKSLFYADSSDKVATSSMRSLEIIAEARLDNGIKKGAATASDIAGSALSWYLAASPSQIDTVELAYLEGNRGVYIETRQGFDVDGLEVKARLDVGAKTMDHRGLLKNSGA
ncbi:prohead protease/major capsid protein fusion protein [Shinella zoogloeoides]|uniref:prohead protease/major capsid protein fusion protein n=1 Tax=Shinella zoogloeoides TaxID=352475 RepID=UPI001F5A062C|nr:prohead protease/major capsid protein fusion protein [Shinella zoogloeoides]